MAIAAHQAREPQGRSGSGDGFPVTRTATVEFAAQSGADGTVRMREGRRKDSGTRLVGASWLAGGPLLHPEDIRLGGFCFAALEIFHDWTGKTGRN